MARGKNPKLRKAYIDIPLTKEQEQEIINCLESPVYFIEKYVLVQHPTKGAVPLKVRDYQKRMIEAYHNNRYVITLASRQCGKSTIAAAYLLWYVCFTPDAYVLVASRTKDDAVDILRRLKYAYEELPMWIKPGVLEDGWNVQSCSFDNGTRIVATATTENTGRGRSVSILYLDELAFVKRSIQEEMWASASPVISTGGKCFITSTPNNDDDLFAELWHKAVVGNNDDFDFKPVFVSWDEVPGRDEEFKKKEIAKIGELRWRREYECVSGDTEILIENEGSVRRVPIEELFEQCSS